MSMLIDTHAFIWWLEGDRRLGAEAAALLQQASNTVYVSAASCWEIATKVRIGKLPGMASYVGKLAQTIAQEGFTPLDVTADHAEQAGMLDGRHKDPFDRMLAAQALTLKVPLLSADTAFDAFPVRRIW